MISQGNELFQNEKNVLYALCWMISYLPCYKPTYVIKTFLYYTYNHCGGECFESFLFFSLVQKKLKFKNISIYIVLKSIYVWTKHMKKDREEKTKFSKISPNNQIITACRIELWEQEMTMIEKRTMIGLIITLLL